MAFSTVVVENEDMPECSGDRYASGYVAADGADHEAPGCFEEEAARDGDFGEDATSDDACVDAEFRGEYGGGDGGAYDGDDLVASDDGHAEAEAGIDADADDATVRIIGNWKYRPSAMPKGQVLVPCCSKAGEEAYMSFGGDGAVVRLPSVDDNLVRGPVVSDRCRCGVVLKLTVHSHPGGPAVGTVAVKVLRKDIVAEVNDSSEHEVEVMSQLSSRGLLATDDDGGRPAPGIPRWDACKDSFNMYIATEFGVCGSLLSWSIQSARVMKNHMPTWYGSMVPRLFCQLAQTVAYMHSRGIVHLDLDVRNVVVTVDEDCEGYQTYSVLVIDFGSARKVKSLTGPGAQVGDSGIKFWHQVASADELAFVSPRRRARTYDGPSADIFHLGSVLWWLLCVIPATSMPIVGPDGCNLRVIDALHDPFNQWSVNAFRHCSGAHRTGRATPKRECWHQRQCNACLWQCNVGSVWQDVVVRTLAPKASDRFSAVELAEAMANIVDTFDREAQAAEARAEETAVSAAESLLGEDDTGAEADMPETGHFAEVDDL